MNGTQKRALAEAMRHTYPTKLKLRLFLSEWLDRSLEAIALGESLRELLFLVIENAAEEGWLEDLLHAWRQDKPYAPAQLEFFATFGAPLSPPRVELERLIRTVEPAFTDIVPWRRRLNEIEGRVCHIHYLAGEHRIDGTGFLVGPDLVLTNHHVMAPARALELPPDAVRFRFDYKVLEAGGAPLEGTLFHPAPDWEVASSEAGPLDQPPAPGQLDFALVRLARPAGLLPVGGEGGGPERGWLELPVDPYSFLPDTPLFIVQHPDGGPMQLDTDTVVGLNENGTRVRYRTNTRGGSSGAPCFNVRLEPVALHQCGGPSEGRSRYNAGIPLTAIRHRLAAKGLTSLLGGKSP